MRLRNRNELYIRGGSWICIVCTLYGYSMGNNEHFITFKFPNAYGGPIEVTELFSKYNSDGTADYRNQIAELLQCYIDRENHG